MDCVLRLRNKRRNVEIASNPVPWFLPPRPQLRSDWPLPMWKTYCLPLEIPRRYQLISNISNLLTAAYTHGHIRQISEVMGDTHYVFQSRD